MKGFLLAILILVFCSVAYAGPVDYIKGKAQGAVDDVVSKQVDRVEQKLDQAGDWVTQKVKGIVLFIVQAFAIGSVGWLMSLIPMDRQTGIMIKLLTVLCVISLVVDKITG